MIVPDNTKPDFITEFDVIKPVGEYKVLWSEPNSLVVDELCYSQNGIDYTEKSSVPMAFKRLLIDRFEGDLYLKYCFEADYVPDSITFNINLKDICSVEINGESFNFAAGANISAFVKKGKNEIVFKLNYKQNENVYHVLFGENITESLKNCILYDTELEPLILKGDFAVYAKDGFIPGDKPGVLLAREFVISQKKENMNSLVKNGYPFFAGKISISQEIFCKSENAMIQLPGRWHAANVTVNGVNLGSMLMSNRMDISSAVRMGKNDLELELIIGNRNLYGPHHYAPDSEPDMQGPEMFEFSGFDKEGSIENFCETMSFIEPLEAK